MGWQRFNRTTNVFEVSDNNGASWQTLVIAAAGVNIPAPIPPTKPNLPASIAYEDEPNFFQGLQTFIGAISIDAANPIIYLNQNTAPANQKLWRIEAVPGAQTLRFASLNDANNTYQATIDITRSGVIMANTGIVSAGAIEVKNQPYPLITLFNNTDPVDARCFRLENWGQAFRLSALNDAMSVSQATILAGNRAGDITVGRTLYTGAGIESGNYVRSAVGLYEFGRAYNAGLPQSVNIFSYVGCPHLPYTGNMCWTVVGTMMHIQLYLSGTVNGGAPNVGAYTLTLPVGATALQNGGAQLTVYDIAGWGIGSVHWGAGSGSCSLYASNLRPWQASQLVYIMGSFWVPIN